jgi:hypothetical protein
LDAKSRDGLSARNYARNDGAFLPRVGIDRRVGNPIIVAFVQPWIAIVLYIAVALIWFIPDRRIEKNV